MLQGQTIASALALGLHWLSNLQQLRIVAIYYLGGFEIDLEVAEWHFDVYNPHKDNRRFDSRGQAESLPMAAKAAWHAQSGGKCGNEKNW